MVPARCQILEILLMGNLQLHLRSKPTCYGAGAASGSLELSESTGGSWPASIASASRDFTSAICCSGETRTIVSPTRSPYEETSRWVGDLPDKLHRKLSSPAVGLTDARQSAEPPTVPTTLGPFLDHLFAGKVHDKKSGTLTQYRLVRKTLVAYFGEEKPLLEITQADADIWRAWLTRSKRNGGAGLADNTARRRAGRAKQFFDEAVRGRVLATSPFGDMSGVSVRPNRSRDFHVTRAMAASVLTACPDNEWRLLFALSRYGGLRCPSEHLALHWGDIDWERGRIIVTSPKTEHHAGKESRVIPLFPELLPYLQAVWNEAAERIDAKTERISELPIITRYRDSNSNLRTQLVRIIKRAGLQPWPKLFQNLRATRETEMNERFPIHVAARWIGHSVRVASENYLQVTEKHFETALEKPLHFSLQSQAEPDGNSVTLVSRDAQISRDLRNAAAISKLLVTPTGLEPVLPA